MTNTMNMPVAARSTKPSIIKRVFRWFLWMALSFIALSVLLVVVFRFAPAHTSGLMIQRTIEASLDSSKTKTRRQYWVSATQIARSAPLAVMASEDQKFLSHSGFDFEQLEKALDAGKKGKRLRGASTISQQTAKNMFLWNGRSYVRKGLEAWFTSLIELCWPKERILEVYLNIVEFGPGIYGVEAASLTYFGKHAKNLNAYEAALLAAVLPNPHRLHAKTPSTYVKSRQQWIVRQMRQLGGEASLSKDWP